MAGGKDSIDVGAGGKGSLDADGKGSIDADGGEEGSIEVDAEVFDGPFVETDAGEAAVVSCDGEVDKHVLRSGKLLNLIPRSATRLWRLLMELLTLDRSFIMF